MDVLVIDKGIVAWEASGRNGGGCTHGFSPLFMPRSSACGRRWTSCWDIRPSSRPGRIRIALTDAQWADGDRMVRNGAHHGISQRRCWMRRRLRELVPLAGDDDV